MKNMVVFQLFTILFGLPVYTLAAVSLKAAVGAPIVGCLMRVVKSISSLKLFTESRFHSQC